MVLSRTKVAADVLGTLERELQVIITDSCFAYIRLRYSSISCRHGSFMTHCTFVAAMGTSYAVDIDTKDLLKSQQVEIVYHCLSGCEDVALSFSSGSDGRCIILLLFYHRYVPLRLLSSIRRISSKEEETTSDSDLRVVILTTRQTNSNFGLTFHRHTSLPLFLSPTKRAT